MKRSTLHEIAGVLVVAGRVDLVEALAKRKIFWKRKRTLRKTTKDPLWQFSTKKEKPSGAGWVKIDRTGGRDTSRDRTATKEEWEKTLKTHPHWRARKEGEFGED